MPSAAGSERADSAEQRSGTLVIPQQCGHS